MGNIVPAFPIVRIDRMASCGNAPEQWRNGTASGFTLLELLIVIGIIGLLSGLLAAAVGQAKTAAELAQCRNNVRQVALGLNLFAGDHHVFPLGNSVSSDLRLARAWFDDLETYCHGPWPSSPTLRARGVFTCPGYDRVSGRYTRPTPAAPSVPPTGAYGYNFYGVGGLPLRFISGALPQAEALSALGLGGELIAGSTNVLTSNPFAKGLRPTRESSVGSPSEMISVGDSILANTMLDDRLAGRDDLSIGPSSPYTTPGADGKNATRQSSLAMLRRHKGRFAIGFLDGHIEALKLNQVFNAKRPDIARRWNADNLPHLERLP